MVWNLFLISKASNCNYCELSSKTRWGSLQRSPTPRPPRATRRPLAELTRDGKGGKMHEEKREKWRKGVRRRPIFRPSTAPVRRVFRVHVFIQNCIWKNNIWCQLGKLNSSECEFQFHTCSTTACGTWTGTRFIGHFEVPSEPPLASEYSLRYIEIKVRHDENCQESNRDCQ